MPRTSPHRALGNLAAVLVLAAAAAAQSPHSWQPLPGAQPAGRRAHAAAWDTARGRLVLFGGDGPVQLGDTWEWDGAAWELRAAGAAGPPPRYYGAMAYDAARGRVVLFGGVWFQTVRGDTWEWDGSAWTQITTAHAPSPRFAHSLTWDPVRRRLVMFGGTEIFGSNSQVGDTWEYDGTDWTRRAPAIAPPARAGHGAAYDTGRGRLVLYAGYGGGASFDDLWEWDGAAWTEVTPATMPPRRAAPLGHDPRRGVTVLYGGSTGLVTTLADTWEWNGAAWRQVATPADAGPRSDHALVFDPVRGELLAVGGSTSQQFLRTSALAGFDGTTWRARTAAPTFRIDAMPAWHAGAAHAVSFGGRIGVFAISDETHLFDGTAWRRAATAVRPPARLDHLLVADPDRDRVVMFGGSAVSAALRDTWEWDGTAWTARSSGTAPSARLAAAGCYDARRRRVVLYGGTLTGFATPLADTWEWDGVDWRAVTTATSPGPRARGAMAFDPLRGVAVLFGGGRSALGIGATDETWEYDGIDWRLAQPASRPAPRIGHSMVWDAVRQRIVLFGAASGPEADETWEYDGIDWVQVGGPVRPAFARLVFDERAGRTLGFADGAEGWELVSPTPPAVATFGTGCGGAAGVLELATAPASHPVVGRTLHLVAGPARAAWPVFAALGASRGSAQGVPLPFDLGPAGMPGCALLQSGDDTLWAIADARGRARFGIAVPHAPALLGVEVFVQAFAPDATANALGWSASAGLALRLGR
jgi:hypothetical protein